MHKLFLIALIAMITTVSYGQAIVLRQGQNGTRHINEVTADLYSQVDTPVITYTPTNQVTATNVLTVATNPTTNDTITIGTDTYTFVTNAVLDTDILIGANVTNTHVSIVSAVETNGLVTMADFTTNNVSILTAVAGGTAGNFATTSDFTSTNNYFASTNMVGGVDVTDTDADILIGTSALYIRVSDIKWESISYD